MYAPRACGYGIRAEQYQSDVMERLADIGSCNADPVEIARLQTVVRLACQPPGWERDPRLAPREVHIEVSPVDTRCFSVTVMGFQWMLPLEWLGDLRKIPFVCGGGVAFCRFRYTPDKLNNLGIGIILTVEGLQSHVYYTPQSPASSAPTHTLARVDGRNYRDARDDYDTASEHRHRKKRHRRDDSDSDSEEEKSSSGCVMQ